jgi:hypothetical protein
MESFASTRVHEVHPLDQFLVGGTASAIVRVLERAISRRRGGESSTGAQKTPKQLVLLAVATTSQSHVRYDIPPPHVWLSNTLLLTRRAWQCRSNVQGRTYRSYQGDSFVAGPSGRGQAISAAIVWGVGPFADTGLRAARTYPARTILSTCGVATPSGGFYGEKGHKVERMKDTYNEQIPRSRWHSVAHTARADIANGLEV